MGEREIEPEETQLPTIASDAHGAGFDQLRRCRDNVDSLVAVHPSVDVCRVTLPPAVLPGAVKTFFARVRAG
jgi:hypothetical protein